MLSEKIIVRLLKAFQGACSGIAVAVIIVVINNHISFTSTEILVLWLSIGWLVFQ